jgi:hypothetical protein
MYWREDFKIDIFQLITLPCRRQYCKQIFSRGYTAGLEGKSAKVVLYPVGDAVDGSLN